MSKSTGNIIEVARNYQLNFLGDIHTPVSVFNNLLQESECGFLFESSEANNRIARFSIIGVDPIKTIAFKKGVATIGDCLKQTQVETAFDNPLEVLREILTSFKQGIEVCRGVPKDFPFKAGLVGYLGYGATQYFENIPAQDKDPFEVPEGFYGLYDSAIVFDHLYRTISVISFRGKDYAQKLANRALAISKNDSLPIPFTPLDGQDVYDDVTTSFTKTAFLDPVARAKELITKGEVFQIVVSQRFSLPIQQEPLNIYRFLQAVNPSPYSYFLKFPEFSYIGSSPETFVKSTDKHVILRALAGTKPRGITEAEDKLLEAELKSNEKELAEHSMLVDLGRNDLGRICKVGTVQVGEIGEITKYSHVMHLATNVTGYLNDDKDAFDVVKACFPRGTVSGAPKVRAMQLLSQLEPEQRGIYSGVIGYFDVAGDTDGAIAIRSALIKDGFAHVNAGAGIVYDSDPESEYEETRNKAKSVITALQLAKRCGQ